jgi:uncharacterized cupredoxin-like copper-binding protein
MRTVSQSSRSAFLGAIVILGSIALAPCIAAPPAVSASHHLVGTRWGTPGDSSKVTRTVTIVATEIKYNVTHLTFRKGETVRFVFVNKGEQPHEFMIADAAEQAEHRKIMSEMSGMKMPAGNHDDGNMVDAKPGEMKDLIWHFTKKGRFEFACNYVGHAEAGMIGTISVR